MPLSRNLGTLTSWNPLGHSGPVTGLLYLIFNIHMFKAFIQVYLCSVTFSGLGRIRPVDRRLPTTVVMRDFYVRTPSHPDGCFLEYDNYIGQKYNVRGLRPLSIGYSKEAVDCSETLLLSNKLHGVISQKTAIFIYLEMKASSLTLFYDTS